MFLQILVVLACVVAGVLLLLTSREVVDERRIIRTARRITAVALLSAAFYIVYTLYTQGGANPVYCWMFGLIALGQLLFVMNSFMDPCKAESLFHRAPQKVQQANEVSHA